MKQIGTMLLLVVAAAPLSHGRAYFAPKHEMIAKSDVRDVNQADENSSNFSASTNVLALKEDIEA